MDYSANNRPRTIQIFLPDGDPSGIRIAELTTSIVRVIEVPRSNLDKFLAMPEAKQVGLYFLVSSDEKNELYIGQSGEVGARIMKHHKEDKKDWERVLVLVSLTNNLTQTHVLYLESLSINKARECDRYELTNANSGQTPHTPTPLKADCHEVHDLGALLLATLGYPIFESITKASSAQEEQVFYCSRANVDAKALYTNQGMVVLKGSSSPAASKAKQDSRIAQKRDELVSKGVIALEGDRYVFQKDHLFNSPSGASHLLLMAASNGWVDWKTEKGVTLSDYQGRELNSLTVDV